MSVKRASKRRTVHDRDGGVCHYCKAPTPLDLGTVDHVWPKYFGGVDANWNLVWSCAPCNEGRGHDVPKCSCTFCADALSHFVAPSLTHNLGDVLGVLLDLRTKEGT